MKAYGVGGAVREELLGVPVADRDWVVVGATPEEMVAAGYKPVGRDFPVFLHPGTREEYALARTERHLRVITRGRERQTLERWRSSCSHLSDADLAAPADLKSWLRRLPNAAADRVLGRLVGLAQRGDASALLAVIVCLGLFFHIAIGTIVNSAIIGIYAAFQMIVLGALTARLRGFHHGRNAGPKRDASS